VGYRELMPVLDGEAPVSLGEGFTPLFHAETLGRTIGLERLYVKDEALNPTNSFKARGQSAAITRAKYLGVRTIALPTAGNAGNAAAAYAAAAGLACEVFMPRDVKQPFVDECRLYGARVTLVDGLITDAGRLAAEKGGPLGWYDVSTLKERTGSRARRRWRRLAEQLAWQWPDWIVYPTGVAPAWSACGRRSRSSKKLAGCPEGRRPRMVSVQAEGCAPIVRAPSMAPRRRRPGRTRRRSPTSCACRARSETS
jgi:threonine synthase